MLKIYALSLSNYSSVGPRPSSKFKFILIKINLVFSSRTRIALGIIQRILWSGENFLLQVPRGKWHCPTCFAKLPRKKLNTKRIANSTSPVRDASTSNTDFILRYVSSTVLLSKRYYLFTSLIIFLIICLVY